MLSRQLVTQQTLLNQQGRHKLQDINTLKACSKQILCVQIDGKKVEMELDTGAPCGIVSHHTLRKIKPECILQPTNRQFLSYSHHRLVCIGYVPVNITMWTTTRKLDLYVIEGDYDSLFGRLWITSFVHEISWIQMFKPLEIHNLTASPPWLTSDQSTRLASMLDKHTDVSSEVAGKLAGPPIQMHLKPGATPVFARAREIPFALRDKCALAIDTKIVSGHYKRVEYSEWASTTHVVMKKNGQIRITGNYKPTLNSRIIIDEYPIAEKE